MRKLRRKFKKIEREKEVTQREIQDFSIIQELPENEKQKILCFIKGYIAAKDLTGLEKRA